MRSPSASSGAFVTFRGDRFDLYAEYYYVHHEDLLTGLIYNSPGILLIGVLNLGKLKPYGGYDRLDVDTADPYYGPEITPLKRSLLGCAGISIRSTPSNSRSVTTIARGPEHGLVVQTAFIF